MWFTKFILSLLLLCVVIMPIQCNPVKNDEVDSSPKNRQSRTFGFNLWGSRDWPSIHHTWKLPSLTIPTTSSFSSVFEDDAEIHESLKKRISNLEIGQRRIVNYLRKLQAEKNLKQCDTIDTASSSTPAPTPAATIDTSKLMNKSSTLRIPQTTTTTVTEGSKKDASMTIDTPDIDIRVKEDEKKEDNEKAKDSKDMKGSEDDKEKKESTKNEDKKENKFSKDKEDSKVTKNDDNKEESKISEDGKTKEESKITKETSVTESNDKIEEINTVTTNISVESDSVDQTTIYTNNDSFEVNDV